MKHAVCVLLVVCLVLSAASTFAADRETAAVKPASSASSPATFHQSVLRAIEQADAAHLSSLPQAPRPRPADGRARNQMGMGGGGKTGMIIGLVSAAVGVGLTVYMVKAMKDSTDQANSAQ